jgi:hypothetical protein
MNKLIPIWLIESYMTQIKEIEQRIKDLRDNGLFGLVPENVAMLESLKYTLNNLNKLQGK